MGGNVNVTAELYADYKELEPDVMFVITPEDEEIIFDKTYDESHEPVLVHSKISGLTYLVHFNI